MPDLDIKIKIRNPGHPLSDEDLAAFECRHEVVLPADYKAYMKRYNGGLPWLVFFTADDGQEYVITQFYTIGADHPMHDLDNLCDSLDWEGAYAHGILEIGRDMSGGKFYLVTRGKHTGSVYHLDMEGSQQPVVRGVKVSPSFAHMMNNLEPMFPEGLKLKDGVQSSFPDDASE